MRGSKIRARLFSPGNRCTNVDSLFDPPSLSPKENALFLSDRMKRIFAAYRYLFFPEYGLQTASAEDMNNIPARA